MSTVQCTSKKNRHKKYIHKSHQGYKYKRMWQGTGRSGEGEGSLTEGRRERGSCIAAIPIGKSWMWENCWATQKTRAAGCQFTKGKVNDEGDISA